MGDFTKKSMALRVCFLATGMAHAMFLVGCQLDAVPFRQEIDPFGRSATTDDAFVGTVNTVNSASNSVSSATDSAMLGAINTVDNGVAAVNSGANTVTGATDSAMLGAFNTVDSGVSTVNSGVSTAVNSGANTVNNALTFGRRRSSGRRRRWR